MIPTPFLPTMRCLHPVILLVLSCGISCGQQLARPVETVLPFSDWWDGKPARVWNYGATHRSAQSSPGFQAIPVRNEIIGDINLPKLNGGALASLYRAFTGRRVIVSAAAATAEFSLVHEASPQHPVTYAQAAELIKRSATIENFTFAPDGDDPNLDVLRLAKTTPRGLTGIPVYNENAPLPEGDEVISYVMTLKYLKPREAVAIFTKSIGEFDIYGSIAVVPNASAIVVTQRTSIIRKVISLKDEMDLP